SNARANATSESKRDAPPDASTYADANASSYAYAKRDSNRNAATYSDANANSDPHSHRHSHASPNPCVNTGRDSYADADAKEEIWEGPSSAPFAYANSLITSPTADAAGTALGAERRTSVFVRCYLRSWCA